MIQSPYWAVNCRACSIRVIVRGMYRWGNYLVGAAVALTAAVAAITGTTFADDSDHDRVVAQAEIRSNFDPPICPSVVVALGARDGSIEALCDDGEAFLIGKLPGLDRKMTMRCSAAEGLLDVKGCTRWGGDTLRNREYVAKIQLACGQLRLPLSECIAKFRDAARQPSSAAAPASNAGPKPALGGHRKESPGTSLCQPPHYRMTERDGCQPTDSR
jgi:hypothetical protein